MMGTRRSAASAPASSICLTTCWLGHCDVSSKYLASILATKCGVSTVPTTDDSFVRGASTRELCVMRGWFVRRESGVRSFVRTFGTSDTLLYYLQLYSNLYSTTSSQWSMVNGGTEKKAKEALKKRGRGRGRLSCELSCVYSKL